MFLFAIVCYKFARLHSWILIFHQGAIMSSDYVMRGRDNHVLNLNKTLQQASIQDGDTLMIGLLGQCLMHHSFKIPLNLKLTLT